MSDLRCNSHCENPDRILSEQIKSTKYVIIWKHTSNMCILVMILQSNDKLPYFKLRDLLKTIRLCIKLQTPYIQCTISNHVVKNEKKVHRRRKEHHHVNYCNQCTFLFTKTFRD